MAEEAEDVPVIYLHEIKREYRQGEATLTILNGAKLALWAGQSVALVAPSGSGKSTLLHIAGLLESPDDGEVYVAGTPSAPRSGAPTSVSSISRIGCCRNSPRSKT
jgi:lipoprotein-releasing system ATP-binding protein